MYNVFYLQGRFGRAIARHPVFLAMLCGVLSLAISERALAQMFMHGLGFATGTNPQVNIGDDYCVSYSIFIGINDDTALVSVLSQVSGSLFTRSSSQIGTISADAPVVWGFGPNGQPMIATSQRSVPTAVASLSMKWVPLMTMPSVKSSTSMV